MRENGSLLLGWRLNGRSALATGLTLDFTRVLRLGRFLIIVRGRFRRWPVLPARLSRNSRTRIMAALRCLCLRQSGQRNHGQHGDGTSQPKYYFVLPCFYFLMEHRNRCQVSDTGSPVRVITNPAQLHRGATGMRRTVLEYSKVVSVTFPEVRTSFMSLALNPRIEIAPGRTEALVRPTVDCSCNRHCRHLTSFHTADRDDPR
jgi:hypothetical protein